MKRTLLALLAMTATVSARPRITVDDSVPFTAKDLADAVEIRVRDTNATIHVARSGDMIVITVGDRARALEVDGAAPHDLARVVALVIVSLAEPPISTRRLVAPRAPVPPTPMLAPPAPPAPPEPPKPMLAPPAPPEPPEPPEPMLAPAPPPAFEAEVPPDAPSIHVTTDSTPPSRYALRASIGYQRTDGGIFTTPFLASLATSITPSVRFVVSGGLDQHGTHLATTTSALGRLGLEGRFGALGLELGGAGFAFATCTGETGTAGGVYGTARIYLPISQRAQLAIEAGGYYVNTDFVTCGNGLAFGDSNLPMDTHEVFDEYAGHVGLGVEWGL